MTSTLPADTGLPILQRHPLLVAVILVAALLVVALLAFPPHYMTNDDVTMSLIVSGRVFDDQPDEHMVFSNVFIGKGLSALYRTWPGVPWYGGYLLAVQVASLVALGYVLLRANLSRLQLLLTAGLLAAFGVPALSWLQFTVAAFSAALAGLLFLWAATEGRAGRAAWVAGPLFLFAGGLVRFDAVGLALIVTAPLLLATVAAAADRRRRLMFALTLIGSLAAVYGSDRFNGWYYEHSPGWAGFYEYNALRAEFTDYDRVPAEADTSAARGRAGWSETDLLMLNEWNYADPQRYSADKLRAVLEATPFSWRPPRRRWEQLGTSFWNNFVLRALLVLGVAVVALPGQGRRARVVSLLCLLVALGVSVGLYYFRHLPERVYLPAFAVFPFVATALSAARAEPHWLPRRPAPAALLAAAALGLALEALFLFGFANAWQSRHLAARAMMARLAPRPDRLYVLWGGPPLDAVVAPLETADVPAGFRAIDFGWTTPTPFTRHRLAQFGIADEYRSLFERDDVLLFARPEQTDLLTEYLHEHYGVRPTWAVVFKDPALGTAAVYRAVAPRPSE